MTVDTTVSSYWLNWRVLLCSLWILLSMIFASMLIAKNECRDRDADEERTENSGQKDPPGILYEDQVWKPCLRSIHPAYLLAFRVFAFIVLLLMLIMNVVVDGRRIFYFYTQWTFALVTIYFALGSILSFRGCYSYSHRNGGNEDPNPTGTHRYSASKSENLNHENRDRQQAGFLAYVLQIIFQMNAGAVMLTDTVFWFIIVPFLALQDYKLNFVIVNMHTINLVFLLVETALNCLRFPWFRIGYFFLWTAAYIVFQWIVHARIWIWWPYPFLDLSSSYAPLWYSTVALMHIPCYGIFLLIMKAKHVSLSKWSPQSYRGVQ